MQAKVEEFLHAGRVEHWDHGVGHGVIALVRGGGRLGGMVVAEQHQHAAMGRRSGQIGVAERVARPVDARALAVPHAEHAVIVGLVENRELLRSPQSGGGQVLVDPGLEMDVVVLEEMARLR